MNPNDYDEDGNNIVPCPICMSNYNPCKNGGKCPDEDDFVRAVEARDFIKKQQELGRNEATKFIFNVTNEPNERYEFSPKDLDTLITKIITNTGEEILRLAEGERKSSLYERKGLSEPYEDYMCGHAQPIEERTYGHNQAIQKMINIISKVCKKP